MGNTREEKDLQKQTQTIKKMVIGLNLIKTIYDKPTASIILNVKD